MEEQTRQASATGDGDITRRQLVKGAAAAGIVIGTNDYVKPTLRLLGVSRLEAAASILPGPGGGLPPAGQHGCTPGFWGNNGGGGGVTWWNVADDPRWSANGGNGTNPFRHGTMFNSFFTANSGLAGRTLWDVVNGGGGSDVANACGRQLVAAYLNASFGSYPFTTSQLQTMWTVATGRGDGALGLLQTLLDGTNTRCDGQ